jgi:hypothetical protein
MGELAHPAHPAGGHVGVGESDGCSAEANTASYHASFTLSRVMDGWVVVGI